MKITINKQELFKIIEYIEENARAKFREIIYNSYDNDSLIEAECYRNGKLHAMEELRKMLRELQQ